MTDNIEPILAEMEAESSTGRHYAAKLREAIAAPAKAEATPAAAPPQEFLTVEEAAELLRVHRTTLYDMANEGVPWAKRIGKQIRVSRTGLLDWFRAETAMPKKRRARV